MSNMVKVLIAIAVLLGGIFLLGSMNSEKPLARIEKPVTLDASQQ